MSITSEEKVNILYIEDDEQLFNLVTEFLKKSKNTEFNVISKTTLESGLEYLQNNCVLESENVVDAVLLDLILPNSRGVNTFKKVKEVCPDTPIIIISAYEDIACECVKQGAQDYLVKPDISPGILIRSIKYAIERVKLENSKKELDDKYRNLVEATGAGIYELDFEEMRFTYVNDAICEHSGYSREELLNMNPFEFLTEEGVQKFASRIEALQKGEYIEDATIYEAIKRDGSRMWIMLTAQFKENKEGRVIGANVVAIDVTDKILAERALKKKEEEVFSTLENKIHKWKEDIIKRNQEKEETLKLINGKIFSMTNKNAEVSF